MSLFIGRLPPDLKVRDLEDIFQRFGRINRLDIKRGASFNFGFIEFEDKRDAEDALRETDGKELPDFGARLVVEWAKGSGGKREGGSSNECFKCGKEGHWARDCREGGGGGRRDRSPPRRRSRSRSPPRRRYDSPPRRRDSPPRRRDDSPPRRRDDSPPFRRRDDSPRRD
ncbi:hypothetical protein BC830DRAFT_1213690 [Chytriomyces sp. MP71]|nr:hypothetical protein BC830DRAFT_1213690 [Chytriomyces sp. MP71]